MRTTADKQVGCEYYSPSSDRTAAPLFVCLLIFYVRALQSVPPVNYRRRPSDARTSPPKSTDLDQGPAKITRNFPTSLSNLITNPRRPRKVLNTTLSHFQSQTTRNCRQVWRCVSRLRGNVVAPLAPGRCGCDILLQSSDPVMRASTRQPETPPATHFPNQHSATAKIPTPPPLARLASRHPATGSSLHIASIAFESQGYNCGD
jgi:hypothetical protein